MNGCSLEDAFHSPDGAPSPGCTGDEGARQARKEERRKARARSKVVAMAPAPGKESDSKKRNDPNLQPLTPPVGQDQEEETFDHYRKDGVHSYTDENPNPSTSYKYHKGPLEDYTRQESRGHYMTMPVNDSSVVVSKKFFGAQGPTDEPYADYLPDAPSYQLEPSSSPASLLTPSSSSSSSSSPSPFFPFASTSVPSLSPPPALDMYWKPQTPSGAQTAYYENPLPPSGKYYSPSSSASRSSSSHRSLRTAYENGEISPGDLMKKLDLLFAKLDNMEYRSTPEQLTSEMLMFISSGIFVLFLMDLLVKRGGSMRF